MRPANNRDFRTPSLEPLGTLYTVINFVKLLFTDGKSYPSNALPQSVG